MSETKIVALYVDRAHTPSTLHQLYQQWWSAFTAEEALACEISELSFDKADPAEIAALKARDSILSRETKRLLAKIMTTPVISQEDMMALVDMALFFHEPDPVPEDLKPADIYKSWQHIGWMLWKRLARELKERAPQVEFYGLKDVLANP